MTKISIYNKDTDVRGNDKWIGSDAQNQNRTKNFTPDNVATYFNENQVIDLGVELRYFYDTLDPLQERVYGSITFETEIGPQVNFSAISTFILSKYTMGHTDVSQFLDFLIGSNVILSRANNINMFGYYKIDSIEPYLPDPNFFVVTLTFEAGNGYMKEDEDYFISLVQFEQTIPDVPTKTSDLINDGEDGVHPFITAQDVVTPTLQSVTDEGNTTTNSILVESATDESSISSDNIYTTNKDTGTGVGLGSDGSIGLNNGSFESYLRNTDVTNPNITLEVPNKPADGSYTIATIEDLPTKTSDLTNDGEDGVNPFITAADIPPVTGFVPYTGATANVDLGEYELKAGQVTLDTTPTGTAAVATTRWNNTIGSSETTLKGGSVVLKNGVDLVARVVNKVTPNATLTKAAYQAVRVSGAQGQRLAVAYAQANSDNNSADTIGVVCETIATNQEGFILTVGQLDEINTSGSLQGETWVDGDVLYLSPTTAGRLTNIKPTGATGHIVVMGYVEYAHAIHGSIYVKIMNGWELDELHNVYITSPANNEGLFYNSADSLWKNKTIAAALGYTPVTDVRTISTTAPLSGGGDLSANRTLSISQASTSTDGYLSSTNWNTFNNKFTLPSLTSGSVLFSNGTTIAQSNAQLFWDNTNNRLGIGTATPTVPFDLRGNQLITFADVANRDIGPFAFNLTNGTFSRFNSVYDATVSRVNIFGTSTQGLRIEAGSNNSITAIGGGGMTISALGNNFSISAGTFILNTGGSERMRVFSSTGNLAINTTTDAGYKLDVNGTARVSGVLTTTVDAVINGANIGLGGGSVSSNVRFGSSAGQSNTTGSANCFIGASAGQSNTSASNNLFFGSSAGALNTTGAENSFFGVASGLNNTTGSNNLFLGRNAGRHIANGSTANTISNNSIFLGNASKALADNQTNQIVIGDTAIGIGSNTVVLGNDSILRTALKGNVLINTTTDAGYKLDVNGTARVSGAFTGGAGITATTSVTANNGNGFLLTANTLTINGTGSYVRFNHGFNAYNGFIFEGYAFAQTSGDTQFLQLRGSFAPTSGTATFNGTNISPTINQTGGANGISRGIYINPTLTSAADFRAIEVANGITILGAATTAKASLRIPSGTAPTTPTNGDIWFDGTNLKMQIGGVTKIFTLT